MDTAQVASFAKYELVATVLKLSSTSPQLYRWLGNQFGAKRRLGRGIPGHYGQRARRFLSRYDAYHMIQDGDAVLEIGTGWVHFESVVIRLFYDVEATLFDVWDNRQLDVLKDYAVQLEGLLYQEMDMTAAQRQRIRHLVKAISESDSFDSLYRSLGFRYVINAAGTLAPLASESFQLVYSCNVLEHVDRETIPTLVQDFFRVLKPGGYSCHEIDLSDHLVSFAGIHGMPEKYYLRFSDRTWERFFENKVQYFNRVQSSEWLDYFAEAGLELVEKEQLPVELQSTAVADRYKRLEKQELDCRRLAVVHRRPLDV